VGSDTAIQWPWGENTKSSGEWQGSWFRLGQARAQPEQPQPEEVLHHLVVAD